MYLPRRLIMATLCGAFALACGSERDHIEKRLDSLRQEIGELQNRNDRLEERVQAMELQKNQPTPAKAAKAGAGTTEQPPLKVIRLEPGDPQPGATEPSSSSTEELKPEERPDDPSPRPTIRLRGKRVDEGSSSDAKGDSRASSARGPEVAMGQSDR